MCQRDKKKHTIFHEEYVKDIQDDQQKKMIVKNDVANNTIMLLNKHEVKDQK